MNPTDTKLAAIEQKIDALTKITNRLRLYFLITVIISVAAILLPSIGLMFVIPQFVNTYTSALNGNF